MVGDELEVHHWGLISFAEAWARQKQLQRALIEGSGQQALIICEHPPVITIGTSGKRENILVSDEDLADRGVSLFKVERGGDVTYHGPGQLVAYPILDLSTKRRDVHWYMRSLEEVIIRTLAPFEIRGARFPGRTGVWVQRSTEGDSHNNLPTPHKIAAIGVRISRWCTLHGVSLNVDDCRVGFSLINPCGFTDIGVTSIRQEIGTLPKLEEVNSIFERQFLEVFDCQGR